MLYFYFQNWTFENKKKIRPTVPYHVLFLFSKPSRRNTYPPVCQVNSQSDPSSQLSHRRLFCVAGVPGTAVAVVDVLPLLSLLVHAAAIR